MPATSVPTHPCLCCGQPMTPRIYPDGQKERPSRFAKRLYCSQSCGRHHPRRPLLENPDDPTTLLVPLTQNQFAIIDKVDRERVVSMPWSASRDKNGSWYAHSKLNDRRISLHRHLMELPGDIEVDHIDRNPLNCRRNNLRPATRSQNCANRAYTNTASGYRGVSPVKEGRKWQARARYKGRLLYLGVFDDPADAARRVDAFWRDEVGENYAYLNFPGDA